MDEISVLNSIASIFKRSPDQFNTFMMSDSEVVKFGNQTLAINVDEYSGTEDYFPDFDPKLLGWNLVIATISDLLAVGAEPQFFLHTWAGTGEEEPNWLVELCEGIEIALRHNNCFLLGGDFSRSESWHYTGIALGNLPGKRLSREITSEHLHLFMTGGAGVGNLAVLNPHHPLKFESRLEISRKLREVAELAIDTSDGFYNSLKILAHCNPKARIEANLREIPIDGSVIKFAQSQGLPKEAFLFGGAGEYELLVGVPQENYQQACNLAKKTGILTEVGLMVKQSDKPGIHWKKPTGAFQADIPLTIDPRTNPDREAYIKEILEVVAQLLTS
jgi:thiamine-monophosphate kinase